MARTKAKPSQRSLLHHNASRTRERKLDQEFALYEIDGAMRGDVIDDDGLIHAFPQHGTYFSGRQFAEKIERDVRRESEAGSLEEQACALNAIVQDTQGPVRVQRQHDHVA